MKPAAVLLHALGRIAQFRFDAQRRQGGGFHGRGSLRSIAIHFGAKDGAATLRPLHRARLAFHRPFASRGAGSNVQHPPVLQCQRAAAHQVLHRALAKASQCAFGLLERDYRGLLRTQGTPNPNFRRVDAVVMDANGLVLVSLSTVLGRF